MNRNEFRAILSLLTISALLLGGTLAASGSPPTTPTSSLQTSGQGPYLYLTNYTFDPLLEATPRSLPTNLKLSSYPTGGPGYYLVQFHGPIQPASKEAIVAAGAQIFDYIPDFAFVVKMDEATKAAVEALDAVRWVGLYQPGYRVAPQLMYTPSAADAAEAVDVTVVVFKGEDMAALTEQLQALGGTILDVAETHWKGKIRVQLAHSQIDAVAHLSGVKWIEPSPEWKLLNDEAADIMGVRDVWDVHGLHGAGQTVSVCDTGLDQGSPSPGNLHDDFENGSGISRVVAIYDLVGGGDGASDVNSGHGTHVAGSVLGNGYRSGSTPGSHTYPSSAYVGMAPEASLVFQAVEDNSSGDLSGIPADLNTLFLQAYNAGARIHTNSWGSDEAGAYTSYAEDVDEFVWDHKNFTILYSAGNEGVDGNSNGVVDPDSMGSPGTAKNCITVGATENNRPSFLDTWGSGWPSDFPADPINSDRTADDTAGMAAFSSRGPTNDSRIKPDVVAPGTFIASVRSSLASETGWGAIDSDYMYMGGTSMATPLTAGAAALVRDYYTDNEGITPSAALVKATLINGATDINPGQYGTGATREIPGARPNNVEGWGRVNVANSLFPTNPRTWDYYDEPTGLSTSASTSYRITVTNASEPLKVTLVWSDYPGTPAADGGLVNDLDLTLTAPSGTTHYPNGGTAADRTNNVENIDLPSPVTGVYTATVRGHNVPQGGSQPYALVVSGAISSSRPSSYAIYLPIVLRNYSSSGGWVTIVSEDFEGTFPGSTWSVQDYQSGYGEYYWAKRNCRAYAGSYSGWAVGGGANGSGLSCGSNYPIYAYSWMTYGPFSLADATAADLSFKLWLNSELDYDGLCRYASIDGTSFYGTCTTGNTGGWADRTLDLANVYTLGDLRGRSSVWIALMFASDGSINHAEGAYADNILLRKCTSSSCSSTSAASTIQPEQSEGQLIETPSMMTLPQ